LFDFLLKFSSGYLVSLPMPESCMAMNVLIDGALFRCFASLSVLTVFINKHLLCNVL